MEDHLLKSFFIKLFKWSDEGFHLFRKLNMKAFMISDCVDSVEHCFLISSSSVRPLLFIVERECRLEWGRE